jgi:benzoate membrane transport protein
MERYRPLLAGAITALVGFTGSFSVVLAGLRVAGASRTQAASGLLAVSVVMGLLGVWLSVRHRLPISIAWSTPGAALLVASGTPHGGFPTAVAAFAICGALIFATGVVEPLRAAVLAIPRSVANGLLAGVLLQLCLVPVSTMTRSPGVGVPVVLTWLVLSRFARRWAVPAAMTVAVGEIVVRAGHRVDLSANALAPHLTLTAPSFSVEAVTLGVSLFVVTMASQNVTGFAVLEGFGYSAPAAEILTRTGAGTVAISALGGHVLNLAAISAALSAGPEAGEDRSRRWIASSFAGACYVLFGLTAGLLAALVAVAPAGLVQTVAGLALLATLGGALAIATADDRTSVEGGHREAAVVTLLVTASGVAPAGIGSAFWGLVAGLLVIALFQPLARPRRQSV